MNRFLFILLFGLMYCSAIAQNPFDIKNRKKGAAIKESSFEKPKADPIKKDLPVVESPAVVPANIPKANPKPNNSKTVPAPKSQEIAKSSNPFDVSHVPLAGSEIKKTSVQTGFTPAPAKAVKSTKNEEGDTKNTIETAIKDPKPIESLKTSEKATPNIRIAEKKKFLERNLPFLLLFISLLVLAFVIGFTKNTITNVIRSTYNENYMKLINKQSNNGKSTAFLLLYSLFFINLALLIFLFVKDKTELHSGLLFSYIFIGLLLAYFIRHLFLFVLGMVFKDIKKESSQYSFTIEVFNICAGLALLPLNFFISFGSSKLSQFALYLAIAVFGIIFLIRTIRAVLLSSRYLVRNKFHYFLYLCTCEIGPVFVLIKILTDYL